MKKKVLKICVAVILVAGIGFGGFFGYNYYTQRVSAANMRSNMMAAFANSVTTEQVVRSELKDIVSATGVVQLKKEIPVYSDTVAKVSEVLVEVGDEIKMGQNLVRYDVETARKELDKKISQAEINLSDAQLTLRSLTLPATSSTVKNLQNSVDSAEKSLYDNKSTLESTMIKIENQQDEIEKASIEIEKAEQKIKENESLLKVGGITQEAYNTIVEARDKAVEAKDSAVQALEDLMRQKESNEMNIATAEKNLQNAQENLAEADVVLKDEADKIKYEQQQNRIKSLQMDLQELKEQLDDLVEYTVSSEDGKVTQINVERGKQVDKEATLLTMADFSQLIVKSNISEYDVPKLKIGQYVEMTSDGIEGVTYIGHITKISNSASTQNAVSGTETVVPVEISVDNVDGIIKPGFNLDLEITAVDNDNALNISISAIKKDSETGGYYVFAVDSDRRLKKTPVNLGVYGDMNVEILSGLNEGDELISSPTDMMRDGMPLDAFTGEMPAIGSGSGPGGQRQQGGMQIGVPGMGGGGGGSAPMRIMN